MWGASYLGMTQWAIAADPPDFVKAMDLQVTASNFRTPSCTPAGRSRLEMALTWLYQIKHQELGLSTVRPRRQPAANRCVGPQRPTCCRLARRTPATLGEASSGLSGLARAQRARAIRGGTTSISGVELGKVPPASFVAGWYDLFLPRQVADYEALRQAGRSARLTIGPWTHSSPGLFGEAVRDGLDWFDKQLGERRARSRRAPVRVFVMGSSWEEFSLWPPAAEPELVPGPLGTLATEPAGRERARPLPLQPARPDARRRRRRRSTSRPPAARSNAGGSTATTSSRYTSPVLTEDLTVVGPLTATLYRALVARTHRFLRAAVRRDQKGKSHNVSDGIIRLTPGSVEKDVDGVFRLEISMWPTANTFRPATGSASRFRAARTRSTPGIPAPASRWRPGSNLRSADQEVFHDAAQPSCITLPVVHLLTEDSLS